jgi:GNAT superfamily N-acetyltransferase
VIVEVADAAATTELRRAVLRPDWAPGSAMPGDDDATFVHLAARDEDGRVVGACVLLPRPCPAAPGRTPAWQLRGMATAADARGQGIGTAVVEAAVREATDRGGALLWCEARESAIGFYAAHGFTGTGARYAHAETGRPHLMMLRELSGPPASS